MIPGKDPESRLLYDSYMLHLPKRQQMQLDRQIMDREISGYVFSFGQGAAATGESFHTASDKQVTRFLDVHIRKRNYGFLSHTYFCPCVSRQ